MDNTVLYVYENQEVRLTGRVAEKPTHPPTSRSDIKRVHQLVEITPTDDINTWKKWVRMQDLYQVINSN